MDTTVHLSDGQDTYGRTMLLEFITLLFEKQWTTSLMSTKVAASNAHLPLLGYEWRWNWTTIISVNANTFLESFLRLGSTGWGTDTQMFINEDYSKKLLK